MEEEKLLIRIAEMYYLEDKNQNQIAKELYIHRTSISRMLKKAREDGIVEISINYGVGGTYVYEKQFQEVFGIKKAIIVPTGEKTAVVQREKLLASAACHYFSSILKEGDKIGFSWGQAMSTFVNELKPLNIQGTTCLPMVGGSSGLVKNELHANTIVSVAAKKLGAKDILVDLPAILESKELRDALMKTPQNQELERLWKNLDIAVFGIGSLNIYAKNRSLQFYGKESIAILNEKRAIGDILAHFYDEKGQRVYLPLEERIISIGYDQLIQTKERIAIAEGLDKVTAILGVLLSNTITTIITTEQTAKEVLELHRKMKIQEQK